MTVEHDSADVPVVIVGAGPVGVTATLLVDHVGLPWPSQPYPSLVVPCEDASTRTEELACTAVPFDHPLWVVFSSGTTGLPKGIVHGHGGIVLERVTSVVFSSSLVGPPMRLDALQALLAVMVCPELVPAEPCHRAPCPPSQVVPLRGTTCEGGWPWGRYARGHG